MMNRLSRVPCARTLMGLGPWGSAALQPRAGSPPEHLGWGARLYAAARSRGLRRLLREIAQEPGKDPQGNMKDSPPNMRAPQANMEAAQANMRGPQANMEGSQANM